MTTTHDNHAAGASTWPAAAVIHPDAQVQPAAHADADLSDADWGAINRELLAEKLASAYHPGVDVRAMFADPRNASIRADWLAVADAAVAEVLGVAP